MKRCFALLAAVIMSSTFASAEAEIKILYNGAELAFNEKPVIVNDKTLVQLRPIAEAMNLEIGFENGQVSLSDNETSVLFTLDSQVVNINGEEKMMDVPMVMRNDYTFVPARELAEPFGNLVGYDQDTKTVIIESPKEEEILGELEEVEENLEKDEAGEKSDKEEKEFLRPAKNEKVDEEVKEIKEISTGSGEYEFTYFYQSQPELEWEEHGRGYCWVCSYAMLFSNISGKVITPLDVAQYNVDAGFGGNYMAGHSTLADSFDLKLVPALSEDSEYFLEFDAKNKGETTLNITTDEDAEAAIREALDKFPKGIIVRYEGYPHSMVAVSYDDENIYFNDPGLKEGEHITFDNTCLKNFKLSDISYIQAVEVK